MRCDQCNKFASFDADVEPEVNLSVSPEGDISGSVRIVNQCADCGQELKATEFDVQISVADAITEHRKACKKGELDLDADLARTERMENKTRTGKTIRISRYMKHMYGAEGTVTVSCDCGNFAETVAWSDEIQGSGMEELV